MAITRVSRSPEQHNVYRDNIYNVAGACINIDNSITSTSLNVSVSIISLRLIPSVADRESRFLSLISRNDRKQVILIYNPSPSHRAAVI